MVDVSVVIPWACDFPHIYFTLNNLASTLVYSRLTHEVIVVENGTPEAMIAEAKKSILNPDNDFGRSHGLKFLHCDIQSNGLAANLGAKNSTGKYLCFCDGHVIVHPNIFKACIEVMERDEMAGLVHSPITWTGVPFDADFQFAKGKRCFQYLYGGWDPKKHPGEWYLNQGGFTGTYWHRQVSEFPYPIAGCGHGFFMIRRDVWERLGGYHTGQRAYGGRESFVTFKSWLFGFKNYTVPETNHVHYNGRRLYEWVDGMGHRGNDVFWRNAMTQAYSIGGDKWLDKTYDKYRTKPGVRPVVLEKLRSEAVEMSTVERKFVLDHQIMPFDDLFAFWTSLGVPW